MTFALLMVCAVVLLAMLVVAAWLWRDPFAIVQLEYARQRRALGLARDVRVIDGDRWVVSSRPAGLARAATIVMVHGFTGSKENWYPLVRALGTAERLLIPDLPGWGESGRIDGADYGFSAQAERIAALIRALSPAVPVVLLGHSMGGGIAAVVAARYPMLVSRVGLFSAAGVRFADNAFGLAVLAGENPFAVDDSTTLAAYLDIVFHDRSALPPMPWPVPSILVARRRRDAAFEQQVLERIGRGDEQFLPGESAAAITQPALLAWGTEDRVIDPSAMALYAACMPHARTLLVADSGHMMPMERPAQLAAAVRALIEGEPT